MTLAKLVSIDDQSINWLLHFKYTQLYLLHHADKTRQDRNGCLDMVAILGFQFGPYHVLVVSALHHCFPLISAAYCLWNVFPQFLVVLLSYSNTFLCLGKLKTVALVLSNSHLCFVILVLTFSTFHFPIIHSAQIFLKLLCSNSPGAGSWKEEQIIPGITVIPWINLLFWE